ncbi:TPA: hypothetical protein JAN03_07300 [Citrobacter freundii]|nr:hypothetical protein [Citrobacter freundii]
MLSTRKLTVTRSVVIALLLTSSLSHATMKTDSSGKIVYDYGNISSYCNGYESTGHCADVQDAADAANLAIHQANQYTDTRINDVKTYIENYVDSTPSGVEKSYVDSADAATLRDAKKYTDETSATDRSYADTLAA